MKSQKSARRTRGRDRQRRTMNPVSLSNLKPIDAVQDGRESLATRVRLDAADARAWGRLEPGERGDLIKLALQIRRTTE